MVHLPTPQGVNSSTFHPAPFDHGLSLPSLYQYHAVHSSNHPAFTYTDLHTRTSHDILYKDAWGSIKTVAQIVSKGYKGSLDKRATIGVLAVSDTLSYIWVILAIMSLGHIVFPLSPRNNPIAHLLELTGVSQVYVSGDPAMQKLAAESAAILAEKGVVVDFIPMVKFEDYTNKRSGPDEFQVKRSRIPMWLSECTRREPPRCLDQSTGRGEGS